jgi:hypothetical protein
LAAEANQLQELIADCSSAEELTRLSFENRLGQVKEEMAIAASRRGKMAYAALLFRGRPVRGSKGIEADFAGQVLDSFYDVVAKESASLSGRLLSGRGPIPRKDDSRMFVTAAAPGSFGFVLEEMPGDIPALGNTPLLEAVGETGRLLQATKDDADFVEARSRTDPEVIKALAKFLKIVSTRDATMQIRTGDLEVAFDDPDTLRNALERISSVQEESDIPLFGTLEGLLPSGRRFEFIREDTGELIAGRISPNLGDPKSLKGMLYTRCLAHLKVVSLQRSGREHKRYELLSLSEAEQHQ